MQSFVKSDHFPYFWGKTKQPITESSSTYTHVSSRAPGCPETPTRPTFSSEWVHVACHKLARGTPTTIVNLIIFGTTANLGGDCIWLNEMGRGEMAWSYNMSTRPTNTTQLQRFYLTIERKTMRGEFSLFLLFLCLQNNIWWEKLK
jgi:hypothetical protein